jgi:hypothetical protein
MHGDGPVKSVREGRVRSSSPFVEVLVMRRSTLNLTLQQLQPHRLVVNSTSTTTIATPDSTVNPPPELQILFTKDYRKNCNNVGGQTKVSFLTTLVFTAGTVPEAHRIPRYGVVRTSGFYSVPVFGFAYPKRLFFFHFRSSNHLAHLSQSSSHRIPTPSSQYAITFNASC